jgi:hypothetical protein
MQQEQEKDKQPKDQGYLNLPTIRPISSKVELDIASQATPDSTCPIEPGFVRRDRSRIPNVIHPHEQGSMQRA